MTQTHEPAQDAANAVRVDPGFATRFAEPGDPVVVDFPPERVLWARAHNAQVAVTHHGETRIYADPAAFYAAVAEDLPDLNERMAEIDLAKARAARKLEAANEVVKGAETLAARAQAAIKDAARRVQRAERHARRLWLGVLLGAATAMLAFGLGL